MKTTPYRTDTAGVFRVLDEPSRAENRLLLQNGRLTAEGGPHTVLQCVQQV
ncbi:hypothetical protein JOD27_008991 [Lentzea nigeriaca]|nr:hypothetical protein [Lentzea nigeriaca]